MKRLFILIIAIFALFFLISCSGESTSSQFVKINDLKPGEIPEIIFLQSKKENLKLKSEEIKKQLKKSLTENKKIIVVKTVYKGSHLFSGEIIFVPTKTKVKNLNVKFITSKERFFKIKEKEVKEKIKKDISEIKDIKAIQSIYSSGYLVGAEIYY